MSEEEVSSPPFTRASADGAGGARMNRLGPRRRRLAPEQPLVAESIASVRQAAIAVVRHGVPYLTVVDDGTLVGIVAVSRLGPPLT